jgi:acetyltransferase-like isoleucine patch superfamily enzyme
MSIIQRAIRRIKESIKPTYPNINKSAFVFPDVVVYNSNNLIMEENTKIDRGSIIMNTNAKFVVKKHSGCAVNLTVITGIHPQFPGRFYRTISKKKDNLDISLYDKDVIVNEDVWIGCNVTLLSGVHIGRSSIVAAGSVVTKSQPPYCLIAGVPAKPIKVKWTMEEILLHEQTLFPENERYTREFLLQEFSKYNLQV